MDYAKIEDGNIIITIPVSNLSGAAYRGLLDCDVDDPDGDEVNYDALARDIVAELNTEDEDGTTPVNTMLDQAVRDASENGSGAFIA